jgi:hypothetical protein
MRFEITSHQSHTTPLLIQKHAPRTNIRTSPPHPSNLFPPKIPSHIQRYLENNPSTLLKVTDPRSEPELSLSELVTKHPRKKAYVGHECHGLHNGPTGIAYLFSHLNLANPELQISSSSPLPSPGPLSTGTPVEWCMKYLAGAHPTAPVESDCCGLCASYGNALISCLY